MFFVTDEIVFYACNCQLSNTIVAVIAPPPESPSNVPVGPIAGAIAGVIVVAIVVAIVVFLRKRR